MKEFPTLTPIKGGAVKKSILLVVVFASLVLAQQKTQKIENIVIGKWSLNETYYNGIPQNQFLYTFDENSRFVFTSYMVPFDKSATQGGTYEIKYTPKKKPVIVTSQCEINGGPFPDGKCIVSLLRLWKINGRWKLEQAGDADKKLEDIDSVTFLKNATDGSEISLYVKKR